MSLKLIEISEIQKARTNMKISQNKLALKIDELDRSELEELARDKLKNAERLREVIRLIKHHHIDGTLIGKIESGKCDPPISTIRRIINALNYLEREWIKSCQNDIENNQVQIERLRQLNEQLRTEINTKNTGE